MNAATGQSADEWTVLDEKGGRAFPFTSFISFAAKSSGQAPSYPIEEGGFFNYNKIESPLHLSVTLGLQGSDSDFEYALNTIEEYKRTAAKLAVVTPSRLYGRMTLTHYDVDRSRENGANLLLVTLELVEVRELHTRGTVEGLGVPKNPTSASRVNVGQVQTVEHPKAPR